MTYGLIVPSLVSRTYYRQGVIVTFPWESRVLLRRKQKWKKKKLFEVEYPV